MKTVFIDLTLKTNNKMAKLLLMLMVLSAITSVAVGLFFNLGSTGTIKFCLYSKIA